jgi:hypothetical protein
MPVILALGRGREEDHDFKASLSNIHQAWYQKHPLTVE